MDSWEGVRTTRVLTRWQDTGSETSAVSRALGHSELNRNQSAAAGTRCFADPRFSLPSPAGLQLRRAGPEPPEQAGAGRKYRPGPDTPAAGRQNVLLGKTLLWALSCNPRSNPSRPYGLAPGAKPCPPLSGRRQVRCSGRRSTRTYRATERCRSPGPCGTVLSARLPRAPCRGRA